MPHASVAPRYGRPRQDSTDHRDCADNAEPIDSHEPTDPTDVLDPMLSSEPADPMLPIDRNEPTLPIDSTDPVEPIDSTEPRDHREPHERPRRRRLMGPSYRQRKVTTRRPRTPPASSRRCASAACSAGYVCATRSVTVPSSTRARSSSSFSCSSA